MVAEVFYEKYRKLSVASLTTGILAVSFCMLYFFLWEIFDDFLTSFIADNEFMPCVMVSYICAGIGLTIAAVVTGSIDLKRIKTAYSGKGNGFDITGIILGSLLILFGFILWFVDFFGFINII